jgi:hypothetical protein
MANVSHPTRTSMAKRFRLDPAQIRPLATGRGSCLASDHITVEGRPVGFMYREAPDNPTDSGWRFFSGAESQDFSDDPANFEICDVNTIANYDRSIVPLLDEAAGSAWAKNEAGDFEMEALPDDPDV